MGERLVEVMIDPGGLARDGNVLDIGCGPGRTAAALTRYLSPSGTYDGFDVMPKSIAWCQKAITSRYPNFRFQVADLENGQYNPKGSQRAADYTFPYPDASFDVAVAGSLFTHLRPFEVQRYLDETARTLRPGGRLIGTWFLLNEQAQEALAQGRVHRPGIFTEDRPPLRLEHHLVDEEGNPFRSFDAEVPEYMIAVDEAAVVAQHERAGLRIVEVRHGHWTGFKQGGTLLGQDAVVAERRSG